MKHASFLGAADLEAGRRAQFLLWSAVVLVTLAFAAEIALIVYFLTSARVVVLALLGAAATALWASSCAAVIAWGIKPARRFCALAAAALEGPCRESAFAIVECEGELTFTGLLCQRYIANETEAGIRRFLYVPCPLDTAPAFHPGDIVTLRLCGDFVVAVVKGPAL